MPYKSHIDYKQLVQEKGKRCADAKCSGKGPQPASAFNKNSNRYDGLQPYCRECSNARRRASEKKTEGALKADARKKRFKEENPESTSLYSAKYRRKVRREKQAAEQDAKLRQQMDEKDKLYAASPSLCGSSLGPHVS